MNISGLSFNGMVFGEKKSSNITNYTEKNYISGPVAKTAFGFSMASNDTNEVIISAYRYNNAVGSVYIYNLANNNLTLETTIPSTNSGRTQNWFGYGVAMNNNYCFVGAPYDLSSEGAVYIYEKVDSSWQTTPSKTLLPTDINQGNIVGSQFGISLSNYNDTLVVGYPGYSNGGVAIYKLIEDSWSSFSFVNTFTNTSKYGFSVSTNGSYIIAGGINSTTAGTNNIGNVAILELTDDGCNIVNELSAPGEYASQDNNFGYCVSMGTSLFAVGSPTISSTPGLVFIYNTSGTLVNTIEVGLNSDIFVDNTTTSSDQFGYSVKFSSDQTTLLVGSLSNNTTGAIYVFYDSTATWTNNNNIVCQKLLPSQNVTTFGVSELTNSQNILVGAYVAGDVFIFG